MSRPLQVEKGKDLFFDPLAITEQLKQNNILVESYRLNLAEFKQWCREARYPITYFKESWVRFEKLLEHYVSLELLSTIDENSTVIDVACAGSPFAGVVKRLYGCTVYRQDLKYRVGTHRSSDGIYEIGGNAADMSVNSSFATGLVLHCSFEMFRGRNDSFFIKEASRVLKPGGRIVIIPLYLSSLYHHLIDPLSDRSDVEYDPDAQIVYRPDFYGVAFTRWYNVDSFIQRVARWRSGMSLRIVMIENEKEVNTNCYLKFAAIFEKK